MNTTTQPLVPPTSLREKIAQLMFVRIGSNLPPVRTVDRDADRITQLLSEVPIGGLILFNGRHDTAPATIERLQSRSDMPMLISADNERGVGQQLHGPELFPHAMAFDALGEDAEQAVEDFAQLTAIESRRCGVHINFAPVADVNVDPRNPIIATRAFGSDPSRVAQLVRAFVRGCQAGGLLSTAKHFPGHGNTHEDSHHALPTVRGDQSALSQCELVSFRAAIDAGVPLIMSAHVRYPAWDDTGAPATLSEPILIDLLRTELGFKGAVVSDSLLMEGVKSQCDGEGELALRALLSGIDILLDVAEPNETLSSLEQAVEDGRLPSQRVDEALTRIWNLKQQMFEKQPPGGIDSLSEKTEALVHRVASESIRVIGPQHEPDKFDPSVKTCAILVRPYESHLDPPQQPLGAALNQFTNNCEYHELGPNSLPADFQRAFAAAEHVEQVLVAIIVKPAAWHAFGLLAEQQLFVEQLINRQPCVLASLGTPEALHRFDGATQTLCTYSDVPASQRALANLLLGMSS